ncbi:MAG TPA: hypothetical protein VLH56_17290 [Dissulfurispiraceae bacterium]|nr:hypothetical protein [Dissulfurispiraceae bacterium]
MEEFTQEELVILGEAPEPTPAGQAPPAGAKAPEGDAALPEGTPAPEKPPEHTEEEKAAAEKLGLRIEDGFIVDEDGTKIPAKRWKTLYRQAKETERGAAETQRKLNLFKELGADKFYEHYPDEKPAGYKPANRELRQETGVPANIGEMVVQGGPHDGKTLNEVYQDDHAYATLMQNQYLDGLKEKETETKRKQDSERERTLSEVTQFADTRAVEMFGKKYDELPEVEKARINAITSDVLDWIGKTMRTVYIDDAYYLMNRDAIIKSAHEKGGKAALASLSKPAIPSIDTGGGKGAVGMDAYESMTSEQLAAKVADMTDAQLSKFLKEAPQSVRSKHSSLPWE